MYNRNLLWIDGGLGLPGYDGDPSLVNWRTKTVSSDVQVFKLLDDGRLFEATTSYELIDEQEEPDPDADHPGFQLHIDSWERMHVDGPLEFYAGVDDERFVYEAYFDDGRLVEINPVNPADFEVGYDQ